MFTMFTILSSFVVARSAARHASVLGDAFYAVDAGGMAGQLREDVVAGRGSALRQQEPEATNTPTAKAAVKGKRKRKKGLRTRLFFETPRHKGAEVELRSCDRVA